MVHVCRTLSLVLCPAPNLHNCAIAFKQKIGIEQESLTHTHHSLNTHCQRYIVNICY